MKAAKLAEVKTRKITVGEEYRGEVKGKGEGGGVQRGQGRGRNGRA